MSESEFERAVREAEAQAGVQAGAGIGAEYVAEVERAVTVAQARLNEVVAQYGNVDVHYLKGFIAEGWHAATYNLDAARQRAAEWSAEVLQLTTRGSPDVRVHGPDGTTLDAQLKYFRNALETGKALSDPLYASGAKVAPADQVVDIAAAVRERAAAMPHRPGQVGELLDTADRVTDRIEAGGVSSRPLTHDEALSMAREAKATGAIDAGARGLDAASTIRASDVAREAGTAALVAVVVSAAPHVIRAVVAWRRGEDAGEHWRGAAAAGASGGLRGAVAAGLTIAARSGALGEAGRALSGSAIGAATAFALQGIGDVRAYRAGEIDGAELASRTTRNASVASGGAMGAAIGQAIIPVPLLGALIGSVVGSFLAGHAHGRLENREAWEAHVALAVAVVDLARQSEAIAHGTELMVRFQVTEAGRLEAALEQARRSMEVFDADIERGRAQRARARALLAEATARLARPEGDDR